MLAVVAGDPDGGSARRFDPLALVPLPPAVVIPVTRHPHPAWMGRDADDFLPHDWRAFVDFDVAFEDDRRLGGGRQRRDRDQSRRQQVAQTRAGHGEPPTGADEMSGSERRMRGETYPG